MSKWFAIVKGNKVGIFYDSWNNLSKEVTGYSGAVFKSFKIEEDAKQWFVDMGGDKNIVSPIGNIPKCNKVIDTVQNQLSIYTDGSCSSNIGGWSCIIVNSHGIVDHYGPMKEYHNTNVENEYTTTNNRSELYAILMALKISSEIKNLHIFSDSNYAIQSITEWSRSWIRNNWIGSKGPVLNKDVISTILDLVKQRNQKSYTTNFQHVYGHSGNMYNERADRFANMGREGLSCSCHS